VFQTLLGAANGPSAVQGVVIDQERGEVLESDLFRVGLVLACPDFGEPVTEQLDGVPPIP
jgi:hypothetical protein